MRLAIRSASTAAAKHSMVKSGSRTKTNRRDLFGTRSSSTVWRVGNIQVQLLTLPGGSSQSRRSEVDGRVKRSRNDSCLVRQGRIRYIGRADVERREHQSE